MNARRFVITGRVQGVGYRRFVETIAYDLNVVGEVWNRSDGAVECDAWADDLSLLDRFERRLLTGPGNPEHISSATIDKPLPAHQSMKTVRHP